MARTGRGEKPPEAKATRGNNPGTTPEKSGKLALPPDAPAKPTHLDQIEGKIWDNLVQQLGKLGRLQRFDEGTLAAYCSTYARLIRNKATLEAHREKYQSDFYTTDGKHGEIIRMHPAVGVIERCEKILRQLAVEFGMTPSARKAMGYDIGQLQLPLGDEQSTDDPSRRLVN